MKFKFSLEKVLRARQITVDLAQKEFNEAMSFFNEQESLRDQMIDLKKQNEVSRADIVSRDDQWSSQVLQINEFLQGQDYRIAQQNKRLSEIEKVVQNRREILLKALTEAKMIEKIKEKKMKEFVSEHLKKEQREIDEIISAKGNSANDFYKQNEKGK
jgi:flagellar protein FliJ